MKRIYKYIIALCLGISVSSCSKSYLEIQPYGTLSEPILSNKKGVDGLLIGAYSLLKGAGTLTGTYDNGWTSLLAPDDARMGSESGVSIEDAFLFDATTASLNNRWKFIYAAVQRCNDVIRITPTITDASEQQKTQIIAEAKFLRGIYYLQLVTLWKNVPWIDETVNYAAKNYLVTNEIDIYPKIEEDFKFASDNLSATSSEVGRANSWAAKSFLVKTYMFQKKFNEAKPILDNIIANGTTSKGEKYKLLDHYADNFKASTRNNAESIFAVQMSVFDGASGRNGNPMDYYNGTYGGPAATCCGWYQPTFDLVDAYQTDPSTGLPLIDSYHLSPIPTDQGLRSTDPFTPYNGTLDSRLDWTVGRRGIPYLDWGVHPGMAWVRSQRTGGAYSAKKTITRQASVGSERENGNWNNIPYNMIRFADILLWAAECEVEVGSLQKAEEYVNRVRSRAANPDGFVKKYKDNSKPLDGFSDEPAANYKVGLYSGQFSAMGKTFARKAVRFERRLELATEHHRYLDMKRYDGLDFDIAATHNFLMAREQARPGFNPTSNYSTGKFIKGTHEYFPIPQEQIDLSVDDTGVSSLKQNNGYN
ncbi:RagB/SusD family nutrient uptake outer membrane protein [Sphingobacterium composti Ten et al. 2007 non Yoo et al. 2007]|uniref:RagB/SusD family nutrient uptake outer membrane protein n=1 Tax=Sphingobacterium composti TaxID=363260 RepID=UPI001357E637|nr:RagB/SusD family nutrient uptake outer membrane protein [Sphingobacterium composti Ten et al. 2007 non Yoo et al. 2007]